MFSFVFHQWSYTGNNDNDDDNDNDDVDSDNDNDNDIVNDNDNNTRLYMHWKLSSRPLSFWVVILQSYHVNSWIGHTNTLNISYSIKLTYNNESTF